MSSSKAKGPGKTGTRTRSGSLTKGQISQTCEALRKANGIQTVAASALKLSRAGLQNRINKYPEIREAYEQARESVLDMAENTLFNAAITNGDTDAAKFLLRTVGRRRGYGDRLEVQGDVKAEVTIKARIPGVDDGEKA